MRIILLLQILLLAACEKDRIEQQPVIAPKPFTFLALGDSYTIGQGVADSLRWPNLLVDSILYRNVELDTPSIVARTGWRSDQLLQFSDTITSKEWDLVTLLIGVNDFYQFVPSQAFKLKFEEMLDTSIAFANGNKECVLVVSIPDYGFTPFGAGDQLRISQGIDEYNSVLADVCQDREVEYISITDISRRGLAEPDLVAGDGLHPSGKQYSLWVNRLMTLDFFKQYER